MELRQTGNQFNSCNTGNICWYLLVPVKIAGRKIKDQRFIFLNVFAYHIIPFIYFDAIQVHQGKENSNYRARIFYSNSCIVYLEWCDSLNAIRLRRQSTSQRFSTSREMKFLTILKNARHKKVKNAKTTLFAWYIDPLIRPPSIKILVAKLGSYAII